MTFVIKYLPEKLQNELYKNFEEDIIKRIDYYKNAKKVNYIFSKNKIKSYLKEIYFLLSSQLCPAFKVKTVKHSNYIIMFIAFLLVYFVFSANNLFSNFSIVLLGIILFSNQDIFNKISKL